jgi:fluoroacetyl-CoA thioesterase
MRLSGRTAEATLAPYPPDGAEAEPATPSGAFPAVLPISRLTALMELAAVRLMQPGLRDEESSVAIEMNVTHCAVPAPCGAGGAAGGARAVAIYREVSGRIHRFTVNVFDETGLIASAEHTRAVVIERRLLAIARRRTNRRSMLLHL